MLLSFFCAFFGTLTSFLSNLRRPWPLSLYIGADCDIERLCRAAVFSDRAELHAMLVMSLFGGRRALRYEAWGWYEEA